MPPNRPVHAPDWNRQYVSGAFAPPAPRIRALLESSDSGLRPDRLRNVVARAFAQPLQLSSAVAVVSPLVGGNGETAKKLLAEMVRATWIQESIAHPVFDRPVFIIAAPRSGSNMLFEQLCKVRGFWHIGGESHGIFDRVLGHNFENPNFESIRATREDESPQRTAKIVDMFTRRLIEAGSETPFVRLPEGQRPQSVRVLDKLPKNSFRVSFLNASFPDARFIYLWREPKGNISSLIEAWREGRDSGRFVTYKQLPGTSFNNWCLVLPPGWRQVVDKALEDITAFQWASANQTALDDLTSLPPDRWCSVSYADLTKEPAKQLRRLCDFAGLEYNGAELPEGGALELSRTTLTPPSEDKWKKNGDLIEKILPGVQATVERIERVTREHAALTTAAST